MDIIEFIEEIDKNGYGISNLNTYRCDNENHYYIVICERGSSGQFYKSEGLISDMQKGLRRILSAVLLKHK